MPQKAANYQIMMEYRYYMDTLAKSTDFQMFLDRTEIYQDQIDAFKNWMVSTPDLSYQYANQIISNLPDPRLEVYQNNDFDEIQKEVLDYFYPITNGLGFYNLGVNVKLLDGVASL